jgi:hypothetical protein
LPTPRDVCISCGYDLENLENAGTCPECATPVALSRTPPTLASQPASILQRWLHGVRIRALSLLFFIAILLEAGLGDRRESTIRDPQGLLWFLALLVLAAPATLGGWILLASGERLHLAADRPRTLSACRVLLTLESLIVPLLALAEFIRDTTRFELGWLAAAIIVYLTSIAVAIASSPLAKLCQPEGIAVALRWCWLSAAALLLYIGSIIVLAKTSFAGFFNGMEWLMLLVFYLLGMVHLPARAWAWIGLQQNLRAALAASKGASP